MSAHLTIYKSSAGSGKTFTLVRDYLKIVLSDPNAYRHVLAVTFTNKATEEMKQRIIRYLADLATFSPDQLSGLPVYQQLVEHFQSEGIDIDIPDRANQVLRQILTDYSHFSVSTIESFFQSVLRAFTRELDIPMNYEVEMDVEVVLQQLVDRMYLDLAQDEELRELLEQFVEDLLGDDKSWNPDFSIRKLGAEIFKERLQEIMRQTRKPEDNFGEMRARTLELAKNLRAQVSEYKALLHSYSKNALQIMDRHDLEMRDFISGAGGPAGFVLRFLDYKKKWNLDITETAFKVAGGDKDWFAKSKPAALIDRIEEAVADGLQDILIELIETLDENGPARRLYETNLQILKNIYALGLLQDLQSKLQGYRDDHNLMLISDTGHQLSHIVSNMAEAPFVYEKVGVRYHYYLLDEFQDTSSMQWLNLRPLVIEGLANGFPSLVVGDVKQSIYRWRNGRLELLLSEVGKQLEERGHKFLENKLDANWRTARDVVEFNNAFFKTILSPLAAELSSEEDQSYLLEAYHDVDQKPKKDHPGLVEIRELNSEMMFENDSEPPEIRQITLEETTQLIQDLKAEGFKGQDIALLVRGNAEGRLLANHLQLAGVRVVSAESLLVSADQRVILLEQILRWLEAPANRLIAITLLHYCSELDLIDDLEQELYAAKDPQSLLPEALIEKAGELRRLPVYECVEHLLTLFPSIAEPGPNLQGFLDAVLEYSYREDASLRGFLEWWDLHRNSRAISLAPLEDAVQILTIHKAKGLEFPVVIMPFVSWKVAPNHQDYLWVPAPEHETYGQVPFYPLGIVKGLANTIFKRPYEEELRSNLLDNLNLLYVGMTRPQSRLYLLYSDKAAERNDRIAKPVRQTLEILENELGADLAIEETEAKTVYQYGQKVAPKSPDAKTKQAIADLSFEPVADKGWGNKVRMRRFKDLYPGVVSEEREAAREKGIWLHEALSRLESASQIPVLTNKMVLDGIIPAERTAEIQADLKMALSPPEVQDWFSEDWDEVRNEADIIDSEGRLLRPDRLMFKKEEAVVVDYKTGAPHPAHEKQVSGYMRALEAVGYPKVKGYLYYLGLGKVQRVV